MSGADLEGVGEVSQIKGYQWKICRQDIEGYRWNLKPSKTNQLENVDTIGWEWRNNTTQPGEIYNRKSKVKALVVNACMNIIANHFNI